MSELFDLCPLYAGAQEALTRFEEAVARARLQLERDLRALLLPAATVVAVPSLPEPLPDGGTYVARVDDVEMEPVPVAEEASHERTSKAVMAHIAAAIGDARVRRAGEAVIYQSGHDRISYAPAFDALPDGHKLLAVIVHRGNNWHRRGKNGLLLEPPVARDQPRDNGIADAALASVQQATTGGNGHAR